MAKYPSKKWNTKNQRRWKSGYACDVNVLFKDKIAEINRRIRRREQLEKISEKRYLTDAEVKELRKLDYLAKVDESLYLVEREMREESEKYAQYVHDVPEWAKN